MKRNSPVLLATILLGVLALGATAFLLFGPKPAPPGPAPGAAQAAVPTPTPSARWVAARDIPPRTVLTSAMMRRDFSSGTMPAGAIQSLADVNGQITKKPILAGETVLSSSFTSRLNRTVDANIAIPSGYRGVAIWVDPDQTAAGLVDVGDRIDVIATHKQTWDKGPNQFAVGAVAFTAGRTIAQDLLVLGVDKSIKAPAPTPTPAPAAPGDAGAPPPPPPPPTPVPPTGPAGTRTRVLVAALPETAARLVAANDQGLLHVTIRNPADGDAGLVPEAREYPSRLITIAPPRTGGAASGAASAAPRTPDRPMRELMRAPRPEPPLPPVMPMTPPTTVSRPDNTGGTGMTAPDAQMGKEITVIRGTEKTRVIVPQR
jgi:Flp pilus assembly protein CpaB